MTSNNSVISEDMLENLAFNRSTWWSEFFESFIAREEGEVYIVDEIGGEPIDDSLGEEEMEYFEEAEEEDAPEDIEHRTLLHSITLSEKKSFVESSEFQDILNATLPVLEEHERKWKNAGLESILNTFDSVRIKKEVGGWMRRNHSVTNIEIESDSSTDSSISWDAGNYIRTTKTMRMKSYRNRIESMRRLNSKQTRHNHGMIIEATRYRAYKCDCCNYNRNRAIKIRQSKVIEQQASQSMIASCSMSRYNRLNRDQFVSLKTTKCGSPSSSSPPKDNFINTAPPKVTNKRMAALKAKEKLAEMSKTKSNGSAEMVKTVRKPTKTLKTSESIKDSFLATITKTNQAFSLSSEDIKENTFLTNVENICNSTAMNGVAARKQLISRPPTINESSETIPSTPRDKGMPNPNNCHATTSKRYAVANKCLSTINEHSISLSNTPHRSKVGLKNICKSKEPNEIKAGQELEQKTKSIKALDPEEKQTLKSIDTVDLISSPSTTDSEEMVKTVRKPTKTPKTSECIKNFFLATITKTNQAFSLSSEDIKENTFLTNVENICNSTAMNGVAARKQLISRPPTINESSETIPSTPRDKGMPNPNNCHATTSKRYAVANKCLSTISAHSISLSNTPHRSKVGLKNIYKSKEPNEVKAGQELEICSSLPEGRFSGTDTPDRSKAGLKNIYKSKEPNEIKAERELEICSSLPEGQFSETAIQDTPNLRCGKKETIVCNERKSPVGARNVSSVRLNADTPTKSITQQRIDKRIPIYKPQQKKHTSDSSFEVTRERLSSVIGEEKARRFFKYNLGAVSFPITSTVYYCPPEEELSSSDSDDDPLEKVGRCGELNESV